MRNTMYPVAITLIAAAFGVWAWGALVAPSTSMLEQMLNDHMFVSR
jgi:hypothetical protein